MISCIICPPSQPPLVNRSRRHHTIERTPTDAYKRSTPSKHLQEILLSQGFSSSNLSPILYTYTAYLYLVSLLEINTNYIEPHILIITSSDNAVLAYLFIEIYLLWKVNVKFCYATLYHLLLFRLFSSWKYQEPCKDTNKPKCLLMTFRK
jgi:hypothetical protein